MKHLQKRGEPAKGRCPLDSCLRVSPLRIPFVWLAGVGLLSLLLDVGSKGLAVMLLDGEAIRWGWLVEFRLTRNTGMAFGLLGDSPLAGILLPLAVVLGGWALLRRYQPSVFVYAASGLVLGGFIGNFVQRLFQGHVLDMLYFPWLPWFVCNVADICICFGVALLAFSLLLRPQDWEEKRGEQDAHH